jgi:2,5-furandicarboxylate decarboxylase 1
LGIDATVPFEDQMKFRRVEFAATVVNIDAFGSEKEAAIKALGLMGTDLASQN